MPRLSAEHLLEIQLSLVLIVNATWIYFAKDKIDCYLTLSEQYVSHINCRAVVVVIVWYLDLQLPVQSVPITTKGVSSNSAHGDLYSIQHYVLKFVSDLWQVCGVLRFPPPNEYDMHNSQSASIREKGPSWSYGGWIYNYQYHQWLSPLTLWVLIQLRRGVLETTSCDKVCPWLAGGRWFSLGTLVSSTNKTDHHDILSNWNILISINLQKKILKNPVFKSTIFFLDVY
jgi:hypothetical protein